MPQQQTDGWNPIYFYNILKSLLKSFGPERPVLLIYDGHASHVDERLIRATRENGVIILKLLPHSSHILQPLDLSVFKSLKVRWEYELINWQEHNEGRQIPKKKFSSLVCKIWKETNHEIISNGFKKGGIFPFNACVVDKEKYDPLFYKRWEQHQGVRRFPDESMDILQPGPSNLGQKDNSAIANNLRQHSLNINREDTNYPHLSSPNSKPGPSGYQGLPEQRYSFEELLLSTVQQTNAPKKVKKRKVCSGAKVITSEEVMSRLIEKDSTVLKEKSKSNKNRRKKFKPNSMNEEEDISDKEIIFQESDDDIIEEEMRNAEAVDACMEQISKPSTDIQEDNWVLAF
ncbi:uncharacterized protein LOC126745992 [Anthonomus grandis grandis]|uniref:uncharacterized protein LOC126745992 n=1 Tax=Anthonomus grandis grandis TaxID=2921223 RepID=UPI00216686EF|nr:uncharacterized protein LOC126745992 [Anthonomus grandis grandis]